MSFGISHIVNFIIEYAHEIELMNQRGNKMLGVNSFLQQIETFPGVFAMSNLEQSFNLEKSVFLPGNMKVSKEGSCFAFARTLSVSAY